MSMYGYNTLSHTEFYSFIKNRIIELINLVTITYKYFYIQSLLNFNNIYTPFNRRYTIYNTSFAYHINFGYEYVEITFNKTQSELYWRP